MKHIKLFEDTQKSFWQISEEEFENTWDDNKFISFDEHDITDIQKLEPKAVLVPKPPFKREKIIIRGEDIDIHKSDDEWFWVEVLIAEGDDVYEDEANKVDYYKCDQIDGLIDCLQHVNQEKEEMVQKIMKYLSGGVEDKLRKSSLLTLVEIESMLKYRLGNENIRL